MKFTIFLLVLLFNFLSVFSQDIILNNSTLPEAEFHVAINPLDSNNIVLAVQHGFGDPNGGDLNIYYSTDFGVNWSLSSHKGSYTNSPAGDPVLSFDDSGHVFLVNLVIASGGINTILSKSTDGGSTWSLESTIATSNTDKPWLAIDRFSASPNLGNIYIPLVGNNVNLFTLDSSYQTINTLMIPDGDHLPSVVVKDDGTVFTSTVSLGLNNIIYVQEYSNGGTNLVHSTQVVSFPDYTFNAPDISLRFQPTAYLAIDNSGGAYDGRLYLSYTASEIVNPNYFNVFLTYSDDNGLTWATPKIVHSNQQSEVQQFYSSMYVNDNGTLILDWYDRKNYANTTKMTDFLMGISNDGGANFTELQLNTVSSDFDFIIPSSNDFGIGEYHQLIATKNVAISFWCDGRTNDGDINIYMTKVLLNGTTSVVEQTLISDKISISTLYPQPAKNLVHATINLKESSNIKYEILDNNGKKVSDSEWVNYSNGKHNLEIDLNFPAGIYFVKFTSDKGYFKSMKLIKI